MFGAIVLRDIPKEEARIDLARMEIQGGFRGFSMVPADMWHYVSVKDGPQHSGFWCRVAPNTALVKLYDGRGSFGDADSETQQQYSQLALSGAMGGALGRYPLEMLPRWRAMARHLPAQGFPPALHAEEEGEGSRFWLAFRGTHGGDAGAFLAEFEWAFLAWYFSNREDREDRQAQARWRHLLLSCYNAGEDRIRDGGGMFADLADALMAQMTLLPDSWFKANSFLMAQASFMAEDMRDSGVERLAQKAGEFEAYLAGRKL